MWKQVKVSLTNQSAADAFVLLIPYLLPSLHTYQGHDAAGNGASKPDLGPQADSAASNELSSAAAAASLHGVKDGFCALRKTYGV